MPTLAPMTDSLLLFPPPKRHRTGDHTCAHPAACHLASGFPEGIRSFARRLCCGGTGPELALVRERCADNRESYRLRIGPQQIRISSHTDAGLWHGLQSLRQLCQRYKALPCVELTDWPDFPERGFMLDISRNKVPSMDSLKELVDLLALLKYNQLQLYTEHTFAYRDHQLVWGDASPLTADEVRALDSYCRDRYIELVPNQNSFGHLERWLRWKEYHHLAECPNGWQVSPTLAKRSGTVLKPNQASIDFMDGLFSELLPHFTSGRFNIGCDETWELGLGWSKPMADKTGRHEVYLRQLGRLMERVRKHRRVPMFWADILLHDPDSIQRLPDGCIPIIWGYDPGHPFSEQCPQVAAAGLPFYVAPGTATWKTLTGNPHAALANIRNAASAGHAAGARGLLLTNWGDQGHHQPWILSLPGLAAASAEAWEPGSARIESISAFLDQCLFDPQSPSMSSILWSIGMVAAGDRHSSVNESSATRLFEALVAPQRRLPELVASFAADDVETFRSSLAKAQAQLEGAPECIASGGSLFQREVRWCLEAAEIALARVTDAMKGKADPAMPLRPSLQALIGSFETLWLERNRPGGLHESSCRLRKVLAELGPPPADIEYYNPSHDD